MSAGPPLAAACVSRTGRRPANEDSALAQVLSGPGILGVAIVCDGMGGHNAGEVASAMSAEILSARVRGSAAAPLPVDPEEAILDWIAEANRTVYARSETQVELKGMGTTVAIAVVTGEKRLAVANVGDSKIFLVRDFVVTQLSVDHTALAERRRVLGDDEVSPEEEISSPFAHALTRSLGQEPRVLPDARSDVMLQEGDVVIVTSDGVTDVLESERFLRAIESSATLEGVAEEIYRLAYEGGSKDNISVALLSYGPPARLGVSMSKDSPRTVAPARPPERPRGSRRAFALSATVAAVAGVALAGFLSNRPSGSPPPIAHTPKRPPPPVAPASVSVAEAHLESAGLRRAGDAWLLTLSFTEPLEATGELAAHATNVRLESRPASKRRKDASYEAVCVPKEHALECTLSAFRPERPLAAGDAVLLRLTGDAFALEIRALVEE